MTRTYAGWQRDRVAWLWGFSGQRVGLLTVATLVAIWPLSVSQLRLAVVALPIAVVLAGVALLRVGGRTLDEWASAVLSFYLVRLRSQAKFVSGAFRPVPAQVELVADTRAVKPRMVRTSMSEPGGMAGTAGRPVPSRVAAQRLPAPTSSGVVPGGFGLVLGQPLRPVPQRSGAGAARGSAAGEPAGVARLRRFGWRRVAEVRETGSAEREVDGEVRRVRWRRGSADTGVEIGGLGMDLPGILAPLRILSGPPVGPAFMSGTSGLDGPGLGVVHHPLDRTFTAVARVKSPGIGLVDQAVQEARVAGWGGLLAGLCVEGSPMVRVQMLHRISPSTGADLRHWHNDHLNGEAPDLAVQVASQLLAGGGPVTTTQRESFLAFTLDARKAARLVRGAGGRDVGAVRVLVRQLQAMSASIASADLQVESWLSVRELGEVIRTAFDPDSTRQMAERRAAARAVYQSAAPLAHVEGITDAPLPRSQTQRGAAGVDPAFAGPVAAFAQPGAYVHDGAYSATFWVGEWPRTQVHASVLSPLWGETVHRRMVSMHWEPLAPRLAEREVMRERTARSVAVRMRQRTGQIVPEHEQLAMARARAQDAERAAGHGLVRFTAYVTVTVTDEAHLDDACAELEADAAAASIELRRMWFTQDVGFAMSAMPFAMGLPVRRW